MVFEYLTEKLDQLPLFWNEMKSDDNIFNQDDFKIYQIFQIFTQVFENQGYFLDNNEIQQIINYLKKYHSNKFHSIQTFLLHLFLMSEIEMWDEHNSIITILILFQMYLIIQTSDKTMIENEIETIQLQFFTSIFEDERLNNIDEIKILLK